MVVSDYLVLRVLSEYSVCFTYTHTRRKIVSILDDEQLLAFDDGRLSMDLVLTIFESLQAENPVFLSLFRHERVAGGVSVIIKGGYYSPGESIQGGPMDATPVIRTEDFTFGGFARDRRAMFWPVLVTKLAMFLFCMAWAVQIRWSQTRPVGTGVRLAVGAVLFLYGRLAFTITRLCKSSNFARATCGSRPAVSGIVAHIASRMESGLAQAVENPPGQSSSNASSVTARTCANGGP